MVLRRSRRLIENLRRAVATSISSPRCFRATERRAKDQTLSRLSLYSALEKHELSERFFRNYIANYFAVLERFVREGIAAGRFRKVDPLLAARGFLGMVVYHSWIQELYGGNVQDFDLAMVSKSLADIWLQGVRVESHSQRKPRRLAHKPVKKIRVRKNGHRVSIRRIPK
jgi:hypothetical protein